MAVVLLSLPDELLLNISESLCIHCQHEEAPEEADFHAEPARSNKITISRLSRTCRRLRRICQPILYHYFASVARWLRDTVGLAEFRSMEDKLVPFLRTLLNRPDLAQNVRTLLLCPRHVPTAYVPHLSLVHSERSTALLPALIHKAIPGYSQAYDILQMLTVAAVKPSLDCLILARGAGALSVDDWPAIGSLPRLKRLALMAEYKDDYHIEARYELLQMAPHLTSLSAADCGGYWDENKSDYEWEPLTPPPSLRRLRKLSMNNPPYRSLCNMLRVCSELDDLELHLEPNYFFLTCTEILEILCKRQLQRLVLSVWAPLSTNQAPSEPLGDKEDTRSQVSFAADKYIKENLDFDISRGYSFNQFCALEILEIDQYILYGRELQNHGVASDYIAGKLPRTLQALHIGFALSWRHLYPSLCELGRLKVAGNLPHLQTVRVDLLHEAPDYEHAHVSLLLQEANIAFVMGENPIGPHLRGMLPGRPAGVFPHTASSYRKPHSDTEQLC